MKKYGYFSFEDGFEAWNNGGQAFNLATEINSTTGKMQYVTVPTTTHTTVMKGLMDYGPLYSIYNNGKSGDAYVGHAIVVTGAVSAEGHSKLVTTNNPWGHKNIQTFHQFKNEIPTSVTTMKLHKIIAFE